VNAVMNLRVHKMLGNYRVATKLGEGGLSKTQVHS
jgi:hypothetical protein